MTATITSKQIKQYKRFIEDAAGQALEAENLGKDGLQELLSHGGEFQTHVRKGIRRFSTRGPIFDSATGKFTWTVNYDEAIGKKTAIKDPLSLAWVTEYATDEKFPDDRNGQRVVTGRIWHPGCYIKQDALERECGGILARPKELIDFSKAFPRPCLDDDMPLAAPGQFGANADGSRYCLCLDLYGAKRGLDRVWLLPSEGWRDNWRFLVLDK